MKDLPEFRKDLVSGDWILVASGRRKRPRFFKQGIRVSRLDKGVKKCPFENPQKNGNPMPLLWYPRPEGNGMNKQDLASWFVQVIPNKYPLLFPQKRCPTVQKTGRAEYKLQAVGYHEVIITRDHFRPLDKMSLKEIELVFRVYQERYKTLIKDPCVKYILIFHNQGETAGASVYHPHSQLVALPVVDPDIAKSLKGSVNFYKTHKRCVHCVMVERELAEKIRIIYKNRFFVALAPFASRVSYEIRIYPLKHGARFEEVNPAQLGYFVEVFKSVIKKLNKVLKNPDYNFFIHTSPLNSGDDHYHWHLEIFPRGFRWAGLELGSGIEVVAVPPEEAAEKMRKAQ
jgi:UDPglucose--hexose-1-phosphate uridylyltransferase